MDQQSIKYKKAEDLVILNKTRAFEGNIGRVKETTTCLAG